MERNDVQAIEKISNEVDESQIKVILSSQCIKAQTFLLNKLKKQSERHRDTCNYISSANLKLESEIKQAEQEIRSMLIAQETLKSANVDIKKEWLLAKNRMTDIVERVADGRSKYEAMWLECKTRHESIPFVQKLLQTKEKQKRSQQNIGDLDKEMAKLCEDIETRRKMYAELNIKRAVELANFMINERPQAIITIKEKNNLITKLNQDIELFMAEQEKTKVTVEVTKSLEPDVIEREEGEELNKKDNSNHFKWEDDSLIPKLNLINFDLDNLDVKLDEVKLKKDELFNTIPTTASSTIQSLDRNVEHENSCDYMMSSYYKPIKDERSRNFSGRKLINILEDININSGQVYNIVKKVNPGQLRIVGEISAELAPNVKVSDNFINEKNDTKDEPIISDTIEEINLTISSNVENIIIPPTQFLDITLSDDTPKKRVCFDLSSSVQIREIEDDNQDNEEVNDEIVNQTMNSQLDVSAASDESFKRIKEMLLKQHNLDLSPQFVYAKNNALQKKDDEVVTSKFFENRNEDKKIENSDMEMEVDEQPNVVEAEETLEVQKNLQATHLSEEPIENIEVPMDVDKAITSSPQSNKAIKASEEQKSEKTVTGLLFTHGTRDIPDSLNVSLSTNGYEDADFPHCIDSSLLLSPKADVTDNMVKQEVVSQDVPNFLSGLRKTGFSFFGGPSTSFVQNRLRKTGFSFFGGPSTSFVPKSESNEKTDNSFNFNFGDEKKNRGGLFNFFH